MKLDTRRLINKTIAVTALFCMATQTTLAALLNLAQQPLFIGSNIPPLVMLTISKDQQLYKKAYNDYTDLDGDGKLDTTYNHGIDYYGYFDSYKCYTYSTINQRFEPTTVNTKDGSQPSNGPANLLAKYCVAGTNQWSGNILNWAAMSRMDAIRKLLYGGLRSTDQTFASGGVNAETVLERVFLPTDAHSWAKYYAGRVDPATGQVVENDISKLTPFNPPITNPAPFVATTTTITTACVTTSTTTSTPQAIPATQFALPPLVTPTTLGTSGAPPCPSNAIASVPSGTIVGTRLTLSAALPAYDTDIPFTTNMATGANALVVGDQIRMESVASPGTFLIGAVQGFFDGATTNSIVRVRVHFSGLGATGGDPLNQWRISFLSRTGISFCNLTLGTGVAANSLSQTNRNPPLLRVVQGNFALWSANESIQCQWREVKSATQANFGGISSNGNLASLSSTAPSFGDFAAFAENPSQVTHGLGTGSAQGEYNVLVKVCVPGMLGTERCKQYPNGNFKPIGLLQQYGDTDLIRFGLMTGSYAKNISGGVLRKNISAFTNEVNVATDGTFTTPAVPPGSPRNTSSAATPAGIVNTLNYMRIFGYNYNNSNNYGSGDNCTFQLTSITENSCTSWGNPMSEIYFESLRYLAGKSPSASYIFTNSGSKDNLLGLPLVTTTADASRSDRWVDQLSSNNYCAPLNVLAFNASVSTNDEDLRPTVATDINSSSTAQALTDRVGDTEGITVNANGTNPFFIGKIVGSAATPSSASDFELCTPKTIPGLGQVAGICPEGPTLAGSFLISGLALQAHTNRIRTNITIPSNDTKSLKVTTYGIQLASNVPQLVIPVPGSTTGQKVVIQPIYRLNVPVNFTIGGVNVCPGGSNPNGCVGGGSLVDLKVIRQTVDPVARVATGKVYINWEDSEQGGDYDQDMWGTLEWVLDANANTISVTTAAVSASTANPQGFGYTISGTNKDGPHFHSGILGFNYTDPAGITVSPGTKVGTSGGCANCQVGDAATNAVYSLGTASAGTLQDPLWYAAKYGAFVDSDGNNLPNVASEWDSKLTNGQTGTDGIPDTYFLVTNPLGLEAALDRAFISILASATASSVAANTGQLLTNTTIYQARFNANDWSGQLLAFTVNPNGTVATLPTWDTGQVINSQDPLSTDPTAGRSIITFNESAGVRQGVAFRWPQAGNPTPPTTAATISPGLVTALNTSASFAVDNRGEARLNYLRGSQANEGTATGAFRSRPISRLGDITNSSPNFVGAPNAGFGDAAYLQFRAANLNRQDMVYVGANDGMMHAVRASDGRELLGYVPSKVHSKLSKLTDPAYVGNQHRYFVDGSPEIQDAFINVGGVNQWRSVLVSGLGAGGQSVFALDVTRPDQFSETNAANIVLWEFSDTDDPDLGYFIGQPVIRKMANGRWAAIVSGGYNNSEVLTGELACTDSTLKTPTGCTTSSTGAGYIFVIFLDGPTGPARTWTQGVDYVKIRADDGLDTPGTPNGLTQPLAADIDADGLVDFIYAGDLRGNLWKFDVRSSTSIGTAWTATTARVILFIAKDSAGVRQPITANPEATLHPTGQGFIVTFGTGKYLEPLDPFPPPGGPPPLPFQTQSFYGIWDKDDAPKPAPPSTALPSISTQTTVSGRTQLMQQTMTTVTGPAPANLKFRVLSANSPGVGTVPGWSTDTTPPTADDSPPKIMGWFMDFNDAGNPGERNVFSPILRSGRLIWNTTIPQTQACQFGGTSFTFVVDPATGARIDSAVLDVTGDGQLNNQDRINDAAGNPQFASAVQSAVGITPTPTIVTTGGLPGQGAASALTGQLIGTTGSLVQGQGTILAYALAAGSTGANSSTVIGLSVSGGRVSWRELLQDP